MLPSGLPGSVLDSAPDAMLVVDPAGTILFANRHVNAVLGHDPDGIVGQSVESLLPAHYRERHALHRRDYAGNGAMRPMGRRLDLYALRRDGTEIPVEVSLSPITWEGRMLVIAAIRDITEQRRTARVLSDAIAAAERANHAKSRLLAVASHDLRQPLQAITLMNAALRRIAADPNVLEGLDLQNQAIAAMTQMLGTLLDLSRLDSGAITPMLTEFSLDPLLEELRIEFADMAAAHGLTLRIERCARPVRSDPQLIAQVLRNLLSNAVKYTPAGQVELRCRCEGELVRIEVRDSGIGIPADQLGHIFDEFYQVGSPPGNHRQGYGLGLSIVRKALALLNAGIDVASTPGRGSSFSITLPAGAPAAAV